MIELYLQVQNVLLLFLVAVIIIWIGWWALRDK